MIKIMSLCEYKTLYPKNMSKQNLKWVLLGVIEFLRKIKSGKLFFKYLKIKGKSK